VRVPPGADTNDEARFYLGVEKAVLFNTHEDGLTEAEAVRRLEKFGRNQLPEKEDNKLMKLALEFVQPMPLMIWAAIFIEVRPRCRAPHAPCGVLGPLVERGAPAGGRAGAPRAAGQPRCAFAALGGSDASHASAARAAAPQALEAGVQHLMDDWIDVIVLLLLQFLNVFLGFFEELKARAPLARCGAGAVRRERGAFAGLSLGANPSRAFAATCFRRACTPTRTQPAPAHACAPPHALPCGVY
jgi:hypothetical protein